jgi:hypothetical protein
MKWFLEYYDKHLRDSESVIWFKIFNPLPVNIFSEALLGHIKNDCEIFFPSPGKITYQLHTAGWKPKQTIEKADSYIEKESYNGIQPL